MSTSSLSGRIAAVTGGNTGIGAGCAIAFAAAGADVALLVHSDDDAAKRIGAEIVGLGRRVVCVLVDVAQEGEVDRAFDVVRGTLGTPEILVNSAGLNMSGSHVADMETETWEQLVRTDLTGPFFTSRRFVRNLRDAGAPCSILNITSIHAFAMRAGGADYAAAKGGLTNLTRTRWRSNAHRSA